MSWENPMLVYEKLEWRSIRNMILEILVREDEMMSAADLKREMARAYRRDVPGHVDEDK